MNTDKSQGHLNKGVASEAGILDAENSGGRGQAPRIGAGTRPIRAVRLSYRTTESQIVAVLERALDEHPTVAVGSYPHFDDGVRRVDIVLKSADPGALDAAAAWMGEELGQVLSAP